MTQSHPSLIDQSGSEIMLESTFTPSAQIPCNSQSQHMLYGHEPAHIAYGPLPWNEQIYVQPEHEAFQHHHVVDPSIIPQHRQYMAEEYPFSPDMNHQSESNAVILQSMQHEGNPTLHTTDFPPQYFELQDTSSDFYHRLSAPPTSSPAALYPQPPESQDIQAHGRYSEPPRSCPAAFSSQAIYLECTTPQDGTDVSSTPLPHERFPTSATPSAKQPQRERVHLPLRPDGQIGLVYVHKGRSGSPEEVEWIYWLPEKYTIFVPKKMRPKDPKVIQDTIMRLKPTIIYTRFQNQYCRGCRSRGICVHFTFLLGAKSTPDGLICDRCKAAANEEPIDTDREFPRVCPLHNRDTHSPFFSSLPEDILATEEQQARAMEFMTRAVTCDWEVLSTTEDVQVAGDLGQMLNSAGNPMENFEVDPNNLDEDSDNDDEDDQDDKGDEDDEDDEDEHTSEPPAKRLKTDHEDENDSKFETWPEVHEISDTDEEE